MKALLSTAASRAWLGVAAIGVVVVALVLGLRLLPRLGAGQRLLDAAKPAISDGAVRGEVGAARLTSQFVDLSDPLMTKGGGATEVQTLVTMIAHKAGVSTQRARAFLRHQAPHTEALLRALPFSGIAREREQLTQFLAVTLNIAPDDLQDLLARDYPHLYQMLSELPSVTSGWRNVPGIEGLTRIHGQRVKSMPQLAGYLRDDVVATVAGQSDRVRSFAGWGGVGYVPTLLLVVGILAIGFGLLHAHWSAGHPSGRRAWGIVVAGGVLLLVVVGALMFFPRFLGAHKALDRLGPVLASQRVAGLRAGTDLVVQTVRFADPIVTAEGGGADEVGRLVDYLSEQTGLTPNQVRGRLRVAAPRTYALLQAIPLSDVSKEVAPLLAVLAHKLASSPAELEATLRRRTPGLAQALASVGPVTSGWDAIPGSERFERFDGVAPVRTMGDFADYLDQDAVPLLQSERADFGDLAGSWPPIVAIPAIVAGIGLLLALYGVAMMFLATKPPARG